jgi:4a-hydroxytetrahydrobiopterin dehydratase
MSRFCDEQAEICGEVQIESEEAMGKELADIVAKEGGDCCVPKKKEPAS